MIDRVIVVRNRTVVDITVTEVSSVAVVRVMLGDGIKLLLLT